MVAEIAGGNRLLAAAAKLKITEATARTHAKHIFFFFEKRAPTGRPISSAVSLRQSSAVSRARTDFVKIQPRRGRRIIRSDDAKAENAC
jgi:hypothetical protein